MHPAWRASDTAEGESDPYVWVESKPDESPGTQPVAGLRAIVLQAVIASAGGFG